MASATTTTAQRGRNTTEELLLNRPDLEYIESGDEEEAQQPPKPRRRRRTARIKPTTTKDGTELAPRFTWNSQEEDFWVWLTRFTAEDWQCLIAYLWRLAPVHDSRFAGKGTSIKKYSAPFDLDQIMREEGSGGYRVDLCHISPTGAGSKRIAQNYFQILNMDFPPRMPRGEWTKLPENTMWRWVEAKAAAEDAHAAAEASSFPDPNQMFTTVLEGIRTLRGDQNDNGTVASQMINMLQQDRVRLSELADPTKQLTTIKALMQAISPPPRTDEASLIVTILRDALAENQRELRDLRNTMAKPRSFLEEVKELLPAIREMGGLLGMKGSGGSGGGNDLTSTVLQVVDKLADHIPQILATVTMAKAAGPAALSPLTGFSGLARPPAAATPPQVQSETPTQDAAVAAQPAASTEPDSERLRVQAIMSKYGELLRVVIPFLVDQFRRNMTGYDFRDWFLEGHGVLSWRSLRDEVGPVDLTNLAMMHDYLRTVLQPPERLLQFLTEFFTERGQEPSPDTMAADTDDGTEAA